MKKRLLVAIEQEQADYLLQKSVENQTSQASIVRKLIQNQINEGATKNE